MYLCKDCLIKLIQFGHNPPRYICPECKKINNIAKKEVNK